MNDKAAITDQRPDSYPQISVIVLTYNSQWKRIRATLNSFLLQKGVSFEMIISDDGSDDNHAEEIKDFLRRHSFTNYELILHEKNQGTVKNFLDAAKHANTGYIKGMGQGDMLSDEYALRDIYEDFIKTDASMGGAGYVSFRKFEIPLKLCKTFRLPQDLNVYRYGSPEEKRESMLIWHRCNFMHGPTMIWKCEALIKYLNILADTGIKYTEDIIPWFMVADEERVSYFDRLSVFYEDSVGFASHCSDLMIKDHEAAIDLIAERIKDKDPVFASRLKEMQVIRINERAEEKRRREKKDKIKQALGIFAWLVTVPFKIYKTARRIISDKKIQYTDTKASTEFAELCMTRE